MTVSGQDREVGDPRASDNKYQQQKTKSIENTVKRWIRFREYMLQKGMEKVQVVNGVL